MAYIGKEFTIDRNENLAEFFKALGISEQEIQVILSHKPVEKLEKDGDGYKLVTRSPDKEVRFKHGQTALESFGPTRKANATWTVDGDTFTQVVEFGPNKVTYKREFSANQLKLTATASHWDGVAHVYYKA